MNPTVPRDCVLPDPAAVHRVRSADGTALNVEEYGPDGAPIVVLAHGWTCATTFWAPVVNRLAAEFRLVAYDQRGHGRSETPATTAGYGTDKLADDLEAVLLATVPAGQRAVLAGHSMGGMTIMAAADRPEVAARTAAALLASTGAGDLVAELAVVPAAVRHAGVRRFLHRQILRSRLPLGPVTAVSRAALKYATMGPAAPADRVAACAQIVHACPTAVRHRWAGVLETLDVRPGLAHLTAPTAVVVGTHDRLTPPVLARRIAAALPNPQGLLELPGTGHMSPVERPTDIATEIRRLATLAAPHPTTAGSARPSAGGAAVAGVSAAPPSVGPAQPSVPAPPAASSAKLSAGATASALPPAAGSAQPSGAAAGTSAAPSVRTAPTVVEESAS